MINTEMLTMRKKRRFKIRYSLLFIESSFVIQSTVKPSTLEVQCKEAGRTKINTKTVTSDFITSENFEGIQILFASSCPLLLQNALIIPRRTQQSFELNRTSVKMHITLTLNCKKKKKRHSLKV